MYTVETVDSVTLLNKDEWDAIGDSPLSSYGWLRTVEETYTGSIDRRYIVVKNRQKIVGGAICSIAREKDKFAYVDSELLGRLKKFTAKVGVSFLPALVCGCTGEHLLIEKGLKDTKEHVIIKDLILDAIVDEAGKHRLPICFPYLRDNEQNLMDILKQKGFSHTPVAPYLYIDIEWTSFEEYLNSLRGISKKIKQSFTKEIRINEREGVKIESVKEPGKYADRLYDLINNHYLKHSGVPFKFKKEFIAKVQEYTGQDCTFYIAWKNDFITATSFVLRKNSTLYVCITAVDRELAGKDMTFFIMSFHRPMIDAITHGIKRIDKGLGMIEMKTRRGCKVGNQFFFYKPSNKLSDIAIKLWFVFLSKYYQKKNALSSKNISK